MSRYISYESVFAAAIVAAVFSAAVSIVLLVKLLGQPPMLALDEPAYQTLKQQMTTSDDPALGQQLHALDVELRAEYFAEQAFALRGSYLLLGGIAVTLLFWQWAAQLRPHLPQLPAANEDAADSGAQRAQWASGAVTFLVIFAVIGWRLGNPSVLSTGLDDSSNKQGEMASAAATDHPTTQLPSSDQTTTSHPAPDSAVVDEPVSAEELAAHWYRFRGPGGSGVATQADAPQTWDGASGKGVKWKTKVSLPGLSSPIVWENRIFLTGADQKERAVFCFEADSGELLWRSAVNSNAPTANQVEVDNTTGFAASTPVTDGRRVYAIFATGDIAAFDFQGDTVWSLSLGVPDNPYGHSASLDLCRDRVIVQLDQGHHGEEKSKLIALQAATGKVAWEVKRESPVTWSSPIVVEHDGRPRVISCSDPWVIANDAETGDEIWRAECLSGEIGPSPVYRDGVVFVAADGAVAAAIRDGGRGDVTETQIAWTAEYALPDICSPLVTDEYVLLVASYGDLACYDRRTGGEEPLWEVALDEPMLVSPTLVGDLVYLIGENGKGWVVRTTKEGIEQVAANDLGEPCSASPAFQPGRIYLRGKDHLFCITQE